MKASDELSRVMGRYKLETENKSQKQQVEDPGTKSEEDSLLDLFPLDSPQSLKPHLNALNELGKFNFFLFSVKCEARGHILSI